MKKIGLALAGGGLKSLSQVAVVADIENKGYEIGAVTGISAGAIVATLVACGLNSCELESKLLHLEKIVQERNLFKKISLKSINIFDNRIDGFVDSSVLVNLLREELAAMNVEKITDCKLPLCIGATEVNTGDLVLFTNQKEKFVSSIPNSRFFEGDFDLASAVIASCGFPFVLSSTTIDGVKYMDGGICCNVLTVVFNEQDLDLVLCSTAHHLYSDVERTWPHEMGIRALELMLAHNDSLYERFADVKVNFELGFNYLFQIGAGKEIINKSKVFLFDNPIEY